MKVTTAFADFVKAVIKEKTQLSPEGIQLKKGQFDFDTNLIWVEIEIEKSHIRLYNEKYRLLHDPEEDRGYLYDYQQNKKIYEWG